MEAWEKQVKDIFKNVATLNWRLCGQGMRQIGDIETRRHR